MSQSLRRELRWALQQAVTVDEVHKILEILLDGLRDASERYANVIMDRRKVLDAQAQEERVIYERNQAEKGNPTPRNGSNERYLNTEDAATFLGLSRATLDKWRYTGGGPLFSKLGNRVRYDRADLEAWMAKSKRRSTSDVG